MTRGLTPAGSTRAWRRLRLLVLERDSWRCQVPVDDRGRIDPAGSPCLLPAVTADHVVPRRLGGQDVAENLRAACEPHNARKGGRLDDDAGSAPRQRAPQRRPAGERRPWHW